MCPIYPRPKTIEETLIDVMRSDAMATVLWAHRRRAEAAERRRQEEMDWLDYVGKD